MTKKMNMGSVNCSVSMTHRFNAFGENGDKYFIFLFTKVIVHYNGSQIKNRVKGVSVCRLYFRSVQSLYLHAAEQELKIYFQKEKTSVSASPF